MRSRFAVLVGSLALAVLAAPAVTHADLALSADIPFQFVAAGRTFGPGTYTVKMGEDLMSVELVPTKGSPAEELVVTRLAEPPGKPMAGRLVFDKVGGTCTFSEIWIPGEDGFLVHATKEMHTHQTVSLRKKAS